jgi:putative transposase
MLDISSKLMQQAIIEVWHGYRNFFSGRSGYPRFKSKKHDRRRFRYPAGARIAGDTIFLPRIGWVRLRLSRTPAGNLKSVTVKQMAGRGFVLALSEFEIGDRATSVTDQSRLVGIDLGVTRLATLSDGTIVDPPRFAKRDHSRMRRASRAMMRKPPGSRNRRKQHRRLVELHRRVADRRKDFLHKLTTSLAATYGGFCVETLDVRGLARTKLSKVILDASLGEFLRQLEYKADWQRKPFVAVGRFYPSTKTCGRCGAVNAALTRSARRWTCSCGASHDRDLNAARNIRTEGLRLLVAAGHADTSNARGAQVRPRIEAQDVEAGTSQTGLPNRFNSGPTRAERVDDTSPAITTRP